MVRALAPDRPDQALNMPVLPGRPEGRRSIPDTHRSDAGPEGGTERSVIVANEIFRRRLPRKCLRDLPRQPLCGRIVGHRKPQQTPTLVAEDKKCKELLKCNGRNHKQINRDNPLRMIADEGLPGLQRPISPGVGSTRLATAWHGKQAAEDAVARWQGRCYTVPYASMTDIFFSYSSADRER